MSTIGNEVWIGVNAAIAGKASIGDDVLIAPNAFINCDIPSHCVVFGNPGIIKHRRQAEHTCTDFYVPYETDYKKALRGNPLSCLTTMYDREAIGDVFFDETYDRHEDYILWLSILKRGIVAKGNHKVLATYVIHQNSKNSNKLRLVKSMYRVYHESQGFNWLRSWILVFRYALYSKKKYRNVK